LLSNLAKSDPELRIVGDAERLIAMTKDERFVTDRDGLRLALDSAGSDSAVLTARFHAAALRFVEDLRSQGETGAIVVGAGHCTHVTEGRGLA